VIAVNIGLWTPGGARAEPAFLHLSLSYVLFQTHLIDLYANRYMIQCWFLAYAFHSCG